MTGIQGIPAGLGETRWGDVIQAQATRDVEGLTIATAFTQVCRADVEHPSTWRCNLEVDWLNREAATPGTSVLADFIIFTGVGSTTLRRHVVGLTVVTTDVLSFNWADAEFAAANIVIQARLRVPSAVPGTTEVVRLGAQLAPVSLLRAAAKEAPWAGAFDRDSRRAVR